MSASHYTDMIAHLPIPLSIDPCFNAWIKDRADGGYVAELPRIKQDDRSKALYDGDGIPCLAPRR